MLLRTAPNDSTVLVSGAFFFFFSLCSVANVDNVASFSLPTAAMEFNIANVSVMNRFLCQFLRIKEEGLSFSFLPVPYFDTFHKLKQIRPVLPPHSRILPLNQTSCSLHLLQSTVCLFTLLMHTV